MKKTSEDLSEIELEDKPKPTTINDDDSSVEWTDEERIDDKNPAPNSHWYCRVCFCLPMLIFHASPMIFKIFRKGIKKREIPQLTKYNSLVITEPAFDKAWSKLSDHQIHNKEKKRTNVFTRFLDRYKLLLVILYVVAWQLVKCLFFGVLSSSLLSVIPVVMRQMLSQCIPLLSQDVVDELDLARRVLPDYLKPPFDIYSTGIYRKESYSVFIWLGLLLILKALQIIGEQNSMVEGIKVKNRVYAVLIVKIYQKVLKLSSSSRIKFNKAHIINLCSFDVSRVCYVFENTINVFTLLLFTLVPTIVLLVVLLGYSAFAGVAAAFIVLPVGVGFSIGVIVMQKKIIKKKDKRVDQFNEMLQRMQMIKLFNWEKRHIDIISKTRKVEVFLIRLYRIFQAISFSTLEGTSIVMSVASFVVMFYFDRSKFTPVNLFVSLTYFENMRKPFYSLAGTISNLLEMRISQARITKFLDAEEEENYKISKKDSEFAVKIEDGSFDWPSEKEKETQGYTLKKINISAKHGELIAICGSIGSGKSSVLHSILGNIPKISGRVEVNKNVSYCSQQPFIFNDTLKNNILFGDEYNKELFKEVVEVSSLENDLKILKYGKNTAIGEKGINLSGGQKMRVQLARVCYTVGKSKDYIVLLDDVLASVDAETGKKIFEKCISSQGFLANTTRVFVTHQLNYLPFCDRVVYMIDGEVSEVGTYEDLMNKEGSFFEMCKKFDLDTQKEKAEGGEEQSEKGKKKKSGNSTTSSGEKKKAEAITNSEENEDISSNSTSFLHTIVNGVIYFKNMGWGIFLIGAASVIALQLLFVFNYYFLSLFSSGSLEPEYGTYYTFDGDSFGNSSHIFDVSMWNSTFHNETLVSEGFSANALAIFYIGLSFLLLLLQMVREVILQNGTISASNNLHNGAIKRLAFSKISWWYKTPIGRVLVRFSSDLHMLELHMPLMLQYTINSLTLFLSSFLIIAIISRGLFLVVFVLFGIGVYIYYLLYRKSNIILTHYSQQSYSPRTSHLEQSINGLLTIRASQKQEYLTVQMRELTDKNVRFQYYLLMTFRWQHLRIDMIGVIMFGILCLSFIMFKYFLQNISYFSYSMADIGVIASSGYTSIASVDLFVRALSMIESYFVNARRLNYYSQKVPIENHEKSTEKSDLDEKWPQKGEVKFVDYSMRYREDLDLVLKSINITFKGGLKYGICGTTGAGKSSLVSSLFRLIEPSSGHIEIDGINIHKDISLSQLRKRVTIVTQDPVLFSGTVRTNLDPFNEYTDEQIWDVLEKVGMDRIIRMREGKLDEEVHDKGSNFSAGERQLLCLGRVLLIKARVVIFDECTANVDYSTDLKIQDTIKKHFNEITCLMIAHRLNTIIDADYIVVMDDGKIAELDTPINLLKDDKYILFRELVKETGEKNEKLLVKEALRHSKREIILEV